MNRMEVDKTFTKDELIRQYEKLNEELAKEVQFSLALKTQLEESSKKIKELNEKSWNLERDRDKLKKKINEIVFNQIAKLEAIKMLFFNRFVWTYTPIKSNVFRTRKACD